MSLKLRRGPNSQRLGIIPAEGELIYTTDTKIVYVGDGVTPGGILVGSTGSQLVTDLSFSTGSSYVGFVQANTTTSRTVQAKLREFVSVDDFGAKGNGTDDDSVAIQNALNTAKYVLLTPGKTYLASGLQAVANGALMCIGGRATIKVASGSSAFGLSIKQSNFVLDGVNFDGGNLGPYNIVSPTFGGRIGVNIGNTFGTNIQLQNISVQNCDIYGFDYAGLYGQEVQIGFVFGHRVTLHNVNCRFNYVNLWFSERFEYINATLCHGYEGYAGIIVQGGNNKLASCSFENNFENCQLTSGENNSHGGFVGCSFNHSAAGGYGLNSVNAEYGMMFTGCFFWYAPIKIENSTGIQIRNSQIVASPITINGGNFNSIDDNYIRDPITPTLIGNTFTTFRRNRVDVTSTSFTPVYGDIYARATTSTYGGGIYPIPVGTTGTYVTMSPSYSVKKWHGADASWMQSGTKLVIGNPARMIQVDAFIKIDIGPSDEHITLEIARYNSLDALVEKFPSSGWFKALTTGTCVSTSRKFLVDAGDKIDILLNTLTLDAGNCTEFDVTITSID